MLPYIIGNFQIDLSVTIITWRITPVEVNHIVDIIRNGSNM